jgi:hypothetical protein
MYGDKERTEEDTYTSIAGGVRTPTDDQDSILIPEGDLQIIGWCGAMEREVAVNLLRGLPQGTFLTRWSTKENCYVITYLNMNNTNNNNMGYIRNIGYIEPCHGGISVRQSDGSNKLYSSLHEYIRILQDGNILTIPYRTNLNAE